MLNLIDFRLVIETLEGVEKDRKCFRMVGGVLVERKVGEVEPALVSNRDKVRLNKDCIEMKFCNGILEFLIIFPHTITLPQFLRLPT